MSRIRKRASFILDEKGFFSTAIVVSILAMASIMSIALLLTTNVDVSNTKQDELVQKSLYIAEAGINNYLWKMNQDENYYKTTVDPAQKGWVTYQDGSYSLSVTQTPSRPGVILESTGRIVNVQSGGSTDTVSRKVKVRIQKKSFVHYLYFTDYETVEGTGDNIWFITGDIIRGPLHTNDGISIDGSPIFKGKVTTSRTIYKKSGSNPDFQQGYEENVQPLEIPTTNQELKTWALVNGYYYYGQTTISFLSSGSLNITNNNSLSTGPTGIVSMPSNGVIYIDGQAGSKFNSTNGDAYVSGTLAGKLTIGTKNNIYITDNVLYNDPNSDVLGLIAENYVFINHRDKYGNDVAPTNIEIDAAVFAINHSFGYEDYAYDVKGTLTVKGAIAQRYRGPVGTFYWSGTKASGYSKNYWYDERMLYTQPPHFIEPLNSGFEVIDWNEL